MSKAEQIARQIKDSRRVCVLTGAGISTESGIPDFRGPGGLWQKFDPRLLSADMLYNDPLSFYRKGMAVLEQINAIRGVEPNRAHYVLAKLEKEGRIDCIITQNIDGLHTKAGSRNVMEVHGSLDKAYCMECGRKYSFSHIIGLVKKGSIPPRCSCGGVLRPDVVLFGDMLGPDYEQAEAEVKKSNLLIVIGSSLEVSPVNRLPDLSSKFIIINAEPTAFDREAHLVWHQQAGKAMGQIYEEVKNYESKN
ncbi:MAG: SIR2 family NAD-dependent protein deacylase [Actinomycetota bacterium]